MFRSYAFTQLAVDFFVFRILNYLKKYIYLKGPYYSNFQNVFTDLAHFSRSLRQDSCDWLFRKNKRFKQQVGVTSVFIASSVPKACKKKTALNALFVFFILNFGHIKS